METVAIYRMAKSELGKSALSHFCCFQSQDGGTAEIQRANLIWSVDIRRHAAMELDPNAPQN